MNAEPEDDGFGRYHHPTWTPVEGDLLGGRYRMVRPAGEGGMAVVWEARDEVLARTVAIKVLAPEWAGDPEFRDRVRLEARAAAAITHPNIAQVHDYGEANDVPYVVMEFVPGGTLLGRLSQGLPQPRFAMRVGAEVAAALAAAHAEGLVHRDVKPANVMLSATGAKVVDFGIAAAIAPAGVGTEDEMIYGTAAYLAPERLRDDAVEPASDVYALGLLLHLMLIGRSPWTIEDTTEMLSEHTYFEPPLLPSVPGVPDYVIKLGNRCLQTDPSMRPSAREAAALLARGAGRHMATGEPDRLPASATAGGEATGQGLSASVRPTKVAAPAGRRWLLIAGVTAALLGAAGTAWLLQRDGQAAVPQVLPSGATSTPASATPTFTASAASAAGEPAATSGAAVAVAALGAAAEPATSPPRGAAAGPAADSATADAEPTATPTATSAPEERTFTSDAGWIRAICPEPSTAEILSWGTTKPYKVDDTDIGPAEEPSVTFRHGNTFVKMTVSCAGSEPTVATG
ncbi:serine/threonine-protein kinase [Actinoplanes tereljensis]|uniref:serine/threonine-protein kinase n=1 Tax=Paractinoplanes tereljensis TaxID=571912 RepID=UPI001944D6E9|nr:serine/threonine-protein kinase [Actinoplanes tereljensis]